MVLPSLPDPKAGAAGLAAEPEALSNDHLPPPQREQTLSVSPFPSVSDDNDLQQENERLKAELDYIRVQYLLLQKQQASAGAETFMSATKTTGRPSIATSHDIARRRKEENMSALSATKTMSSSAAISPQILHHRHFKKKAPRSNSMQLIQANNSISSSHDFDDYGDDDDCEHGLMDIDTTASSSKPLIASTAVATPPQQYSSSLLADSMDPIHFLYQVQDRAQWLVGLLVLQSMSSFIIARNEAMLQKHLVLVQFLTMLVGAGGNAGNQSSVRVIRGLATGQITNANIRLYLWTELKMACILCLILGTTGCVRTLLFFVPLPETVAITTSLCLIVMTSIILGALLPLGMRALNIDPAHSSTTIQVLMDIMGVTTTVCVGTLILDSPLRQWFA